jgi:hypothetical protein
LLGAKLLLGASLANTMEPNWKMVHTFKGIPEKRIVLKQIIECGKGIPMGPLTALLFMKVGIRRAMRALQLAVIGGSTLVLTQDFVGFGNVAKDHLGLFFVALILVGMM